MSNRLKISIILFLTALRCVGIDVPWPDRNIWPESPQARSIREVMMPSASVLTGAVDFSIPLYTVDVEGFRLPVSLQYHSNGIRPDDDPQPIGWGWVLTPPMRISRQINGRPDEYFKFIGDKGDEQYFDNYNYWFQALSTTAYPSADPNMTDPERDFFTVYLPDATLKLMYIDGSLKGLDCEEYKVECGEKLDYIRVTDPAGVIYDFSEKGEMIEWNLMTTEWLLSTVTLTSGTEIKINWTNSCHKDKGLIAIDNTPLHYSPGDYANGVTALAATNPIRYRNLMDVESITFPGGKLTFGNASEMISELVVRNMEREVFRADFLREKTDHRFLTGVRLSDRGTYRFEYDDVAFNSHTGGVDWWGYYNGADQMTTAPTIQLKGMDEGTSVYGANRKVSARHIRGNLLRKVIYPTGGSAEWEYEMHRFAPQKAPLWVNEYLRNEVTLSEGGGVRVKSVTLRENEGDDNPRVRRYVYGADGNGLAQVEATPFLHTFFSETGFVCNRLTQSFRYEICCDRQLSPSRNSNYLNYQPGLVPIWYDKVTEIDGEGKTEYEFEYLCPGNEIERSWGEVHPVCINTAFSKGPQMVAKTIYKSDGDGYRKVAKEEYFHEMVENGDFHQIVNLDVWRTGILLSGTDYLPDFGPGPDSSLGLTIFEVDGREYNPPGFDPEGTIRLFKRDQFTWFGASEYSVYPQTERLAGKKITTWFDNGQTTVTERFEYQPHTNLVVRSVRGNGSDSTVTKVDYHYEADKDIARKLAERNVRNIPLRVTESYRSATSGYSVELGQFGSTFRPRKITLTRGDESWSNSAMDYDTKGRLTSKTTADGVTEYWKYDTFGNPVETGIADSEIVSKASWQHLIGVESLTSPSGTVRNFTYNSDGLLSSTSLNGRILEQYHYNFDASPRSFITTYSWTDKFESQKVEHTLYYDGLGRKSVDQVEIDNGTFVTSLTEYDHMGRTDRQWAPVATGKDFTLDEIRNSAVDYYSDNKPYKRIVYEPSQRAIPVSSVKEGDLWHDSGKVNSVRVITNDNSRYRCSDYRISTDGVKRKGYHAAGTLVVEETTDEDGVVLVTYKDFRGNLICRDQGGLVTQFIYDDFGDLRYILPPGLDGDLSMARLNADGYIYKYDNRGRLVYKKFPGASASLMKYDDADRLVAEHSSNHEQNGWRIYGYDFAGRKVLTLDVSNTSESSVKTFAEVCRTAKFDGGPYNGYSLQAVPEKWKVVSAMYYDNHTFIDLNSLPEDFRFKGETTFNKYSSLGTSTGLLTGTFTGAGYEAYYHNTDGEVIQRYATGFNRGRSTNIYNYDGTVAEVIKRYSDSGLKDFTTRTEYNRVRKPLKIKMSPASPLESIPASDGAAAARQESGELVFADTASMIMTYDGIGRLSTKRMGGNLIKYDYDVHGWLRQIDYIGKLQRDRYTERLCYADGTSPCYNGNISSRHFDGQRYDYTYDSHNRLISAEYSDKEKDFSTAYAYDDLSNITRLVRHGVIDKVGGVETFGTLDSILVEYTGNRVTHIRNHSQALSFTGLTGVGHRGEYIDFAYDSSGRLFQDESRGISDVFYDNDGNRTKIYNLGGSVDYTYDGMGNLCRMEINEYGNPTVVREYTGDGHIIENGEVIRTPCPGGYFSGNGGLPLYYLTDYQGNNIATLTELGTVLERQRYYPYGEPWREPVREDFLFSANERIRQLGLNEYNFHARNLYSAVPRFDKHDPLNEGYPWLSPYSYCGGNPVMHTDKSGEVYDIIWDVGNIIFDVGAAVYYHTQGDTQSAKDAWVDAAFDFAAALIPGVPAGATKVAKLFKGADKAVDAAKVVDKAADTVKATDKTIDAAKTADKASDSNSFKALMAEGKAYEDVVAAELKEAGVKFNRQIRLVPVNGKGNVKGNRTTVDFLIDNGDNTYTIIEAKLRHSTPLSTGQRRARAHVKTGNQKFIIRTNIGKSSNLKINKEIRVTDYVRRNKYPD